MNKQVTVPFWGALLMTVLSMMAALSRDEVLWGVTDILLIGAITFAIYFAVVWIGWRLWRAIRA